MKNTATRLGVAETPGNINGRPAGKAGWPKTTLLGILPAMVCLLLPFGAGAQIYGTHKIFAPGMTITQVNPSSPASPASEDVTKVIDGSTGTKYLNFNKTNTGFTVNTGSNSIVRTIAITTANDAPERDPVSYTLEGSNNGTSWSSITSGSVACTTARQYTRSFPIANSTSYSYYRVVFPTVCTPGTANSMQVAEVQLYQADGVGNTSSGIYYTTIQAAVNAAASGNTIVADAGTYAENVTVDKSLTILGPNANTNACTGTRVAEAIVIPAVTETSNQSTTSGTIFRLGSASGHINVTIKGFTIDGHNAALSGGLTMNGTTIHTGAGVTNSVGSFDANPGGYDVKMIVQNNIIQNLERYGVLADGISGIAMSGTDVSYNKIDNLPSGNGFPGGTGGGRGRGIAFEENHYGTATGNCISRVNVGWQDDNYYLASTGAGTVVSNNTISSYHRGIFHNQQYSGATAASITGNTVSAESSNNSGTDFGVELASIQSTVGATVTGNNVTGKKYGLLLWNCPTTGTITISGGTLNGNNIGILATDNDPQFGAAVGASTFTLSGITVTGGATGLQIEGTTTVSSLSGVAFSGQSGDYIKLSGSANNVNGTGASYGGVSAGAGLTNAQAFVIENKITDKMDNNALGLVRLKAANVYVTATSTIQQGINAASANDNVNVAAGTYKEDVSVNKSVSLLGANSGISGCGTRGAESIVMPATLDAVTGKVIDVTASDVTISGFTIDGDNPSLSSIYTGANTTANIDAAEGISMQVGGVNNLTVTNNIVRNLTGDGVVIFAPYNSASTNHTVANNKFMDLGTYGSNTADYGGLGVLIYNNAYTAITNNCMDNVRIGVQTGNFHLANTGASSYQAISNNTITNARTIGIWHNLAYSNASAITVSNNSVSGVGNANETYCEGIFISSLSVPSSYTNNIISINAPGEITDGYDVWNVDGGTSAAAISGGSVSGAKYGVWVNNFDGYVQDATFGGHATLGSISINPIAGGRGIYLQDNPAAVSNVAVQVTINSGVQVNGGADGLYIEGDVASVSATNDLAFNNQTANYIRLDGSANNVNATAATFDGKNGATATLAENFAIENKIVHKIDNGALGYLSVKANQDFVTPASFISPATTSASIQRGIDAASNGFTVNVSAGTYNESVQVNKEVAIKGAQSGILGKGSRGSESIVDPPMSTDNVFNVLTDNVTIDGFTITNSNAYPASERNGVLTINKTVGSGHFTGVVVKNNIISRQFKGVNFNFTDNYEISRNWFHGEDDPYNNSSDWVSSYGSSSTTGLITNNDMDGYASAVEIQGNATQPVSAVTISENRSTGSQYVLFGLKNSSIYRNSILNSTSGSSVYIGGGCSNDLISENFIDNGNYSGIRVLNLFGAGVNAGITVTSNSITGHNQPGTYEINVDASAYTDSLAATCNWLGTNVLSTVKLKVNGPAKYIPYRPSGTDASTAPGFQPDPLVPCSTCTLATTAAVTPLYTLANQQIQTIYKGYPGATQTENIALTATNGTTPYTYTWTMSNCNNTTVNPAFSYSGSTYAFNPSSPALTLCAAGGANNVYIFNATVTDAQGCSASQTKKINVVNPYGPNPATQVYVCHKVTIAGGGTSGSPLTVTPAQAMMHLAHGDVLGNCSPFAGRETGTAAQQQHEEEEGQISVYPNPSTGTFIVELPAIETGATIVITDVQGRVVAQKQLEKDGTLKATFELGTLSRGLYLVMVKDGDKLYRSKITLQ